MFRINDDLIWLALAKRDDKDTEYRLIVPLSGTCDAPRYQRANKSRSTISYEFLQNFQNCLVPNAHPVYTTYAGDQTTPNYENRVFAPN